MPVRTNTKRQGRKRTASQLPAFILGGLGVLLGALLVSRQSAKVEAAAGNTTAVVGTFDTVILPVPIDAVPAGTRVGDIQVRKVAFPKQQVPEGSLTSLEKHADAYTLAALPANLPLFEKNLGINGGGAANNAVIQKIPPGMRAMSVKVDATTSVEGWAGIGSMVDVVLTDNTASTVVAEQVKIISVESSVAAREGGEAAKAPKTVTLLVTQEQSLAISAAIPLGKLSFLLRGVDDPEPWLREKRATAEKIKRGKSVETREEVSGYVSFEGQDNKKGFVLLNGKWIRADSVPEGFMVGQDGSEIPSKNTNAVKDDSSDQAQGND